MFQHWGSYPSSSVEARLGLFCTYILGDGSDRGRSRAQPTAALLTSEAVEGGTAVTSMDNGLPNPAAVRISRMQLAGVKKVWN